MGILRSNPKSVDSYKKLIRMVGEYYKEGDMPIIQELLDKFEEAETELECSKLIDQMVMKLKLRGIK